MCRGPLRTRPQDGRRVRRLHGRGCGTDSVADVAAPAGFRRDFQGEREQVPLCELGRPDFREGCHRRLGRGWDREHGPWLRTRPRDGCGDYRFRGQVARTGYVVTDYAATEAKRGWPPLWKRPRDCRGGRRLCGQGRADSRRVRPRERGRSQMYQRELLWEMSSWTRPLGGRRTGAETAAMDEVTGWLRGASLPWTRPRL